MAGGTGERAEIPKRWEGTREEWKEDGEVPAHMAAGIVIAGYAGAKKCQRCVSGACKGRKARKQDGTDFDDGEEEAVMERERVGARHGGKISC